MDREYLERLIWYISNGDTGAFGQLYERFYPDTYRFVGYFIRGREDRQDVVADTFKNLWQNRHLLPGIRNLQAYIYTVAHNEAYRHLRTTARYRNITIDEMPVEVTFVQPDNDLGLLNDEATEIYRRAVEVLPERCKLIFLAVREQKLRHKEVASILNISEGTIERQINIATRKLVEFIKAYLPEMRRKKQSGLWPDEENNPLNIENCPV
ncbi:MAG: sigma-70 family RNA polymerase sigma factor [Alistipes sp.]|nr:sigma-70 family RNA polymerase sigma factor [Alistipes sp.]